MDCGYNECSSSCDSDGNILSCQDKEKWSSLIRVCGINSIQKQPASAFRSELAISRNCKFSIDCNVLVQSQTLGCTTESSPTKALTDLVPLELLIFGRGLPVRQILQFRCVSKQWQELLDEWMKPNLPKVKISAGRGNEEYWFIMAKARHDGRSNGVNYLYNWDFVAYSDKEQKLFCPPLPNIHHVELTKLLGGMNCNLLVKNHLRSAGGFMCAAVFENIFKNNEMCQASDRKDIIVFNCITGFVHVLPRPQDPTLPNLLQTPNKPRHFQTCSLRMSVDDHDSSRYYIMLSKLHKSFAISHNKLEPFCGTQYIEVYDSVTDTWKEVAHHIHVATSSFLKVSRGDFFFYMMNNDSNNNIGRYFLLAYHVVEDTWAKIQVQNSIDTIGIGKCYSRLFSCCPTNRNNFWTGFRVMELLSISSESSSVWVEVSSFSLPQPCSYYWGYPKAFADGRFLVLSFSPTIGKGLTSRSVPCKRVVPSPVVYDMANDKWHMLPSGLWSTNEFECELLLRPLQGY